MKQNDYYCLQLCHLSFLSFSLNYDSLSTETISIAVCEENEEQRDENIQLVLENVFSHFFFSKIFDFLYFFLDRHKKSWQKII